MVRTVTDKELCHERLGAQFDVALSRYDTQRRLSTLVDDFLTDEMISGKLALDVGCGLGFFSQRLVERGAIVTACDVGSRLLQQTQSRAGCSIRLADVLSLTDIFGRDSFDVVVSSECIEHVPSPEKAIEQIAGVLKPGGFLSLSTPNRIWQPVVRLATKLHLRPFDGYENFTSWASLRQIFRAADLNIVRERGLHLFPFQLGLHELSEWCDRRLQCFRGLMINICVLAHKKLS